jgi:hypothetical protein
MPRHAKIERLFFYEMYEGDLKKLEALSNVDPTAGGGARDLRFPHVDFKPIMEKLFPGEEVRTTTRTDPDAAVSSTTGRRPRKPTTVTIRIGNLVWTNSKGEEQSETVECHPPTVRRPSEGRLARIHSIPPLRTNVPNLSGGRVFLVLGQYSDGRVFPQYVREDYLQSPQCDKAISGPILACAQSADELEAAGRARRRVQGYVDYVTPKGIRSYCHGR